MCGVVVEAGVHRPGQSKAQDRGSHMTDRAKGASDSWDPRRVGESAIGSSDTVLGHGGTHKVHSGLRQWSPPDNRKAPHAGQHELPVW